eukprot:2840778-Pleurochrysis_carterae.AAC.1
MPTFDPSVEDQDAAELAKAEEHDGSSVDTSDTEYDPDRPYQLWVNYYHDDDDGAFDPDRVEALLEADNKAYAEHREFRAAFKSALAHGDPDVLIDVRRTLSDKLTIAQHEAARSSNPSSFEGDIRRYAKYMT